MLALYSFGLAALANGNYAFLWTVIREARTLAAPRDKPEPIVLVAKMTMMDRGFQDVIRPDSRYYEGAYLAQRLYDQDLWSELQGYFPEEVTFRRLYSQFEYLYGMAGMDIAEQVDSYAHPNVGCMPWQGHDQFRKEESVRVKGAIESDEGWTPIRGGMFDSDKTRALKALEQFDELLAKWKY